jgi:hypothetical protein
MKLLVLLLLSSSAFAEEKFNEIYTADVPPKATEITYKEDGGFLQVTNDSWIDRVKTADGQKYHKFEQGYNYIKKQGFIRVFDESGKLIQETWDKEIDGAVAKEELLKAFELFKANEIVKQQLKKADSNITIHGGFSYQDHLECQAGNRCVHVFASTPSVAILAHSIVRLADDTLAYPDFERVKFENLKTIKNN